MLNLKIFGERVAIKMEEEAHSGTIIIPQTSVNMTRSIGRVMGVGDGRVVINFEPKQMEMVVKEGDIVVFQMNSVQQANAAFVHNGEKDAPDQLYILPQGDLLARIPSTAIKLADIEMLGPWCLVEPFADTPKHGLIIPDSADPIYSGVPHFRLVKKGSLVKLDIQEGREIVPEKALVTRLEIEGKTFGFVHAERIYGVVTDSEQSPEEAPQLPPSGHS